MSITIKIRSGELEFPHKQRIADLHCDASTTISEIAQLITYIESGEYIKDKASKRSMKMVLCECPCEQDQLPKKMGLIAEVIFTLCSNCQQVIQDLDNQEEFPYHSELNRMKKLIHDNQVFDILFHPTKLNLKNLRDQYGTHLDHQLQFRLDHRIHIKCHSQKKEYQLNELLLKMMITVSVLRDRLSDLWYKLGVGSTPLGDNKVNSSTDPSGIEIVAGFSGLDMDVQ
jgi:hypothetical protein